MFWIRSPVIWIVGAALWSQSLGRDSRGWRSHSWWAGVGQLFSAFHAADGSHRPVQGTAHGHLVSNYSSVIGDRGARNWVRRNFSLRCAWDFVCFLFFLLSAAMLLSFSTEHRGQKKKKPCSSHEERERPRFHHWAKRSHFCQQTKSFCILALWIVYTLLFQTNLKNRK